MDETKFREVYKRINDLSNMNREQFNSEQIKVHHKEINRLKDIATVLLDEIEAGQKKTPIN